MEDEPDKLRRNTVVLSGIILVFGYLNLTFPKELLGFGIPPGSDKKIWVLLLIVSIYSMLRYHFSGEAVALRNEFSEHMRLQPSLKRVKLVYAAAQFRRYVFAIPCAYDEATSFLSQLKDLNSEFFNLKKIRNLKVANSPIGNDGSLGAPLQINFTYYTNSHGNKQYNYSCWLSLTFTTGLIARMYTIFSLFTSPKNVVDLFVPYAMFAVALASLSYRLKFYA